MESKGLGLKDGANNSEHPPGARHLTGCFIFINPFTKYLEVAVNNFSFERGLTSLGSEKLKDMPGVKHQS